MADDKRNQCAHKGCSCAAGGDSNYCGAACEVAMRDDVTSLECGCGHSGCAGEIK